MKEIKQCIVLVDSNTPPCLKHTTAGRYKVGAKTGKEAEKLVRKKIGFGKAAFYCYDDTQKDTVKYKEVKKYNTKTNKYEEPRHATEKT